MKIDLGGLINQVRIWKQEAVTLNALKIMSSWHLVVVGKIEGRHRRTVVPHDG
jgi:hypothetical protein